MVNKKGSCRKKYVKCLYFKVLTLVTFLEKGCGRNDVQVQFTVVSPVMGTVV